MIRKPRVQRHSCFVRRDFPTALFHFFLQWHAFSIPELQNFLVILEKEEAERVRAVEQKYSIYREKLQQALRKHDP